jgi:hypothetical protein
LLRWYWLLLADWWAGRESRAEHPVRARLDVGSLTRLRFRNRERKHRYGQHQVGGFDRAHDATGTLVPNEKRFGESGNAVGQVLGTGVVALFCNQVDDRGGCDRLTRYCDKQVIESRVLPFCERLELTDVVVEDRHRKAYPIREVAIEAALSDAGTFCD